MPSKDERLLQRGENGIELIVDPATLAGELADGSGARWVFGAFDGVVEEVETTEIGCRAHVRTESGRSLTLTIAITPDGATFSVDVAAADAEPTDELQWPSAFLPGNGSVTELALPIRTTQGVLHHPNPSDPVAFRLDVNGSNQSGLSMPFWFQSTATGGLLAILQTPSDVALDIQSDADGARVAVGWLPALGRFDQPRTVQVALTKPGYVAGALRYRAYVAAQGRLVSLAEKAKQRPGVAGLVGAPYFSTGYLPFTERKLRQVLTGLTDLGFSSGLIGPVDLVQWGAAPWLNDYQPFISEPGFANIIEDAGFTPFAWFYLEDQLEHDPTFDPDALAVGPDGTVSTGWQNRDYVYRRVCDSTIAERGRLLRERVSQFAGLHFDTTTAKELSECWSPDHPMTRDQNRQARHDWLAEVASWGHVVGSESGADWAYDVIDFCSNNPREDLLTYFPGTAHHIPLHGLVYHDCVISYGWEYDPYNPSYLGGDWAQAKIAYDLMCGNPPTVSPLLGYFPRIGHGETDLWSRWVTWEDPLTQQLLRAALPVADLHARVAHQPMTNHAYLDPAATVSRTTYADGTEVLVNAGPTAFVDDNGIELEPWSWSLDGSPQRIGVDGHHAEVGIGS